MSAGLGRPAVFGGLATLFLCPTLIGLDHVFLHVSTHNAIGSIGGRDERAPNFSVFFLRSFDAPVLRPSLPPGSIHTIRYPPPVPPPPRSTPLPAPPGPPVSR